MPRDAQPLPPADTALDLRAAAWPLRSAARAIGCVFAGALILSMAAALLFGGAASGGFGWAIYVAAAVFFLVPSRVRVGNDALHVRWFVLRETVRFVDVTHVERMAHGIKVHRAGRRPLELLPRLAAKDDAAARKARIEELARAVELRAQALRAPDAKAAGLMADLDQRAKRLDELRALLARARGHRDAALDPEELWSVVQDGAAPPKTRVAAAVALRPTLDENGQARLRVAAQASALPRLRVAIEAAANDDDDAVLEAIESFDREHGR